MYTVLWKRHFLMAAASLSRVMCPAINQTWFRNDFRTMEVLPHNLQNLTDFFANILVPDTKEHLPVLVESTICVLAAKDAPILC